MTGNKTIDPSSDDSIAPPPIMSARLRTGACIILCSLFVFTLSYLWHFVGVPMAENTRFSHEEKSGNSEPDGIVPHVLMGAVYKPDDFVNSRGISPPFWDCNGFNCTLPSRSQVQQPVWGPCFAPRDPVNWAREINLHKDSKNLIYEKDADSKVYQSVPDLSGLCRPGFIIIGAGKCGTSSLYHYLVDHPRVVPAKEKQIHYFKYYSELPMKWYLRHFPNAVSFLGSGALMTGEASPGYLPYPDVVKKVRRLLPGPRIIAIGRHPLERAYSSYKYNYLDPLLNRMKSGKIPGIEKGKPLEYYDKFIFSFEDMVRAEMILLNECLKPNGPGEIATKRAYETETWIESEFERRRRENKPSLVFLDGVCYGERVNNTIPRKQWIDLMRIYPQKVIEGPNWHLIQSFLGRGIYTLPLEWWYATFPHDQIHFVCTEEISDLSGAPLNELAAFLGLPEHNFSEIVAKGAYNVGGHAGYDNEIPWSQVENGKIALTSEIPLSKELRSELEEFFRPWNERLFALIGKRCNW